MDRRRLFLTTLCLTLGYAILLPAEEPKPSVETETAIKKTTARQEATAKKLRKPVEMTNSIGMKLRLIPPGNFLMGSIRSPEELVRMYDVPEFLATEECFENEQPQHQVQITQPFYLGVTEVTQGQWKAVMGTSPWKGEPNVKEGMNYPAVNVSWKDAIEFCEKLGRKERKTYRLPTEAEWEYACRAGTTTLYSFGNDLSKLDEYAWFRANAVMEDEEYAHQVGKKKPNAFGLYDMHGNVFEWCSDWWDEDYYADSPVEDPAGPRTGSNRVYRGGAWCSMAVVCRSADRIWYSPAGPFSGLGFRIVARGEDLKPSAEVQAATKETIPRKNMAHNESPKPGKITNSIGMKLRLIPPGEFVMGSPDLEGSFDEHPQHLVQITQPFYLGITEVTQGQWKAVMGTSPWKGEPNVKEGVSYPAVNVSWKDAVEFCEKLGRKEGKTYRLPTEAEWEYACRAGTTTLYSFDNDLSKLDKYAWFRANAVMEDEEYAHQVGKKKANAFGLYDMHGNVFEWCSDFYNDQYYPKSALRDPTGPRGELLRVVRGGAWCFNAQICRSAFRSSYPAFYRLNLLGFRITRVCGE